METYSHQLTLHMRDLVFFLAKVTLCRELLLLLLSELFCGLLSSTSSTMRSGNGTVGLKVAVVWPGFSFFSEPWINPISNWFLTYLLLFHISLLYWLWLGCWLFFNCRFDRWFDRRFDRWFDRWFDCWLTCDFCLWFFIKQDIFQGRSL